MDAADLITPAMVEAALVAKYGRDDWPNGLAVPPSIRDTVATVVRQEMQRDITAALAASALPAVVEALEQVMACAEWSPPIRMGGVDLEGYWIRRQISNDALSNANAALTALKEPQP